MTPLPTILEEMYLVWNLQIVNNQQESGASEAIKIGGVWQFQCVIKDFWISWMYQFALAI